MSGRDVYRWVARGEADCPICARLDGEERSLGAWQLTRMPGFHRHCDCRLEPVIDGMPAPPTRPRKREETRPEKKAAPRYENFRGVVAGRKAALKPRIARMSRPRVGKLARHKPYRAPKYKKGAKR